MLLKSRSVALSTFFLILAFTGGLLAQSTSSIQGTVLDSSGAVVANAKVTVHNQGTAEERSTQTDSAGNYVLPALPVGIYQISAAAPGMQSVSAKNLTLEVARTVVQNFNLKVASTTEVVEITAAAPVLESTTQSVGTVINQRTVQDIPLNGAILWILAC